MTPSMTTESVWQELEREPASTTGWVARLATPAFTAYAIQIAYEQSAGVRALLFPTDGVSLPRRAQWPECAGLDLQLVAIQGQRHLALKLRDRATADVFSIVADDLVTRLAAGPTGQAALAAIFNQLGRWQLFLAAARDVLGAERQRGLFGELLLATKVIAPRLGLTFALDAWKGASRAHQDFQFVRGAIEVKTSAAKQPTAVRISSERQLDDTGVGELFLHVYVLDEREVPSALDSSGESLPSLVARIRRDLAGDVSASSRFEEKLLLAGWLDHHAPRYENRRWAPRSQHTYRVQPGFPRIVESSLSRGIGEVSYLLDLAACEPFRVQLDAAMDALS
jgi:hypothetical protein